MNETCFGFGNACSGPLNTNRFNVQSDGDGGFTVDARLANALVPGPEINASLHFTRGANGQRAVEGTRDGYPSFEAYYYGEDGTVQEIISQKEGKPRELWGCCDTKVQSD